MKKNILFLLGLSFALPAAADDLGLTVDNILANRSPALFGIAAPLASSAPASPLVGYRKPGDVPGDLVALAPGLTASFVTRKAGQSLDMLLLYPTAAPTHIIACVESARAIIGARPAGGPKYNPSIQRIEIATGKVTTILRGMNRCDGIRVTPWNTVIVNEETADGKVYEVLKPLATTEATVLNRATGAISTASIRMHFHMPFMAWEGFAITREGVVYGGDELRPGTGTPDTDGGALYKFIPDNPWDGSPVTSLSQSPLNSGLSYALQISCMPTTVQFGQGCEEGNGNWIDNDSDNARADANAQGATGYYRPEDLHIDPEYPGPGVRVCVSITGNEAARNYAKVLCFTDRKPLEAPKPSVSGVITPTVNLQQFILGDTDFNSFDNLEFQPKSRNLHVVEDHPNGDVFACLQDGRDRDIRSDGCVRWLSVKDSSAEPTGLIFDATGTTAFLSISHSNDSAMPAFDGFGTDDLIRISGFKN